MRILDLFAGIGGFSLAGHWAGHETAAFIEKDPFCQQVLKKNFAGVPIYGDIKEFDGTKYKGTVDIICGGFPCQPFSVAGKRKGTDDDRHLWPQMLRVIREVKPTWVIGENVGGFLTIGEGLVFEQTCLDLEAEGYEVQAFVIPAVAVNAPHRRDRVWIVAHAVTARKRGTEWEKENEKYAIAPPDTDSERARADNDTSSHADSQRELQQERSECDERGRPSDKDNVACNSECGRQSGNTRRRSGQEPEDGYIEHQQSPSSHGDIMRPQEQGNREQADRAGQSNEITADSNTERFQGSQGTRNIRGGRENSKQRSEINYTPEWDANWIEVAAILCRMDDGLPVRVDRFELSKSGHRRERLKSLGNSIVPQVAYEIFKAINEAT